MSPLVPAPHAALDAPRAERLAELLEATAPRAAQRAGQDFETLLPVPAALAPLVPRGALPRGQVTEVAGAALIWALAGAAVLDREHGADRTGCAAILGWPEAGLAAAVEAGIDPGRLLVVDTPGELWPDVLHALAPAVDVIVLGDVGTVAPTTARRLESGALRRGRATVLTACRWPGSPLRLAITVERWFGLGDGHGLLSSRQVRVEASGRGRAGDGRLRPVEIWLPDAEGRVRPVEEHERVLDRQQPNQLGLRPIATA